MELLHPLDANKKLLLYTADSLLYALTLQGERFSRPFLLCSNYDSGLSSAFYRGTVYYTYINKEFSLLVRNSSNPSVLFRLDCTSYLSYHLPQLVVFNETLLLFYFEKQQDTYSLHAHALFTNAQPSSFLSLSSEHFSELPQLTLFAEPTHLYLLLSDPRTSRLLRYTTDFHCSGPLEDTTDLIVALAEKDRKVQTTEQHLNETQQKLETAERLLTEKEQVLQNTETLLSEQKQRGELSEKLLQEQAQALERHNSLLVETQKKCQEIQLRLAEREASLKQTALLLERAKTQYEELMRVAEQYKAEALKWYTKFTDRH